MKHTKKNIFIFIFCILECIAFQVYSFFAPPCLREPYQMKKSEDTLNIAFIGDSWACMHIDQKCIIPNLLEDSIKQNAKVYSFGLSGKTSKEIYEAMFDNYDFMQFMQQRRFYFCIIAAGINDVNKKMSTKYYKESMNGIIQLLLSNNIYPIILEIPDFDVYKVYRWWRIDKKLLRQLSMKINGIPVDCKQIFRNALDELINEKGYQNKVSIIRYNSWNNNYKRDLKLLYLSDGLHLNDYGYIVLDSTIYQEIRKCIYKKKNKEQVFL